MPTFKKCAPSVSKMATEILTEFESHAPVLKSGVLIDFVFAYCDRDEKGNPLNAALSKNGMHALGITRKIALKDRVLGRADAEISLDGDWWDEAPEEQQRALLDHELHHIAVKIDSRGLVTDDIGRPVLKLRKHEIEVGWFKIVAARHGKDSMERIQARKIMAESGQYFWPELEGEPPPIEGVPMKRGLPAPTKA